MKRFCFSPQVLANMLMNSEVNPFDAQEARLGFTLSPGRELLSASLRSNCLRRIAAVVLDASRFTECVTSSRDRLPTEEITVIVSRAVRLCVRRRSRTSRTWRSWP